MKKPIIAAALVLMAPTVGFTQDVTGHVTFGGQIEDTDTNSSKFNEYRDINSGFYLYDLGLQTETKGGYFLDAKGKNVGRDDQNLSLQGGSYGKWGVGLEWDEIIHNLSNHAKTPYVNQGGGLLTVPTTVSPSTRHLAPTAAQQQANDLLTGAYMAANAKPITISNDRKKGTASFYLNPLENLKFRVSLSNEDREGNKVSYGQIGDRPPRSLDIQLAEPIDYRTQEAKLEADYTGKNYQANLSYLVSSFDNSIDTLTWQNIYVNPLNLDASGTYEQWTDNRAVAAFGRRPLPQDNLYQNVSLSVGVDLPMNSRATATASYGLAEQDETLIPYSTNGKLDLAAAPGDGLAWNDPAKLPRAKAEAEIETKLLTLDYTINPIDRLNLRAFYRFYDLANNTPTDEWRYVTGDTLANSGDVAYVNKRRNLAYEYDKQNLGLDGNYSLPLWASTLGLGYERESVDREYREASTDENIYRVSLRSRPAKWVSFRTKYQYGDREADHYDGESAHETYWYSPSEATTANTAGGGIDSQFSFENHPDTRRFDVTDRKRNQFDFQTTVSPAETVDVSASYRYRKDDYDSNVQPSQPLAHYAGDLVYEADATTPGDQVGLLKDERHFVGVDVNYTPNERLRVGAFASYEKANTLQRGFEFNENFKTNPNGIADTQYFGDWTRESMQWMADIKDTTYTLGLDTSFAIIPDKLTFNAGYNYSMGKTDIGYSGFGAVTSLEPQVALADNTEFAFRTPPTVRSGRHTVTAGLAYEFTKNLATALNYRWEYYKIEDWQQAANTPWSESVGGDNLTRDTSASSQWGNRFPNLGSYLAPRYEEHVVSVAMTYKF